MLKEHATKADSALFHVQIRGAHGEGKKLTRAQWLEIADGCDTALGRVMTQQGRAASLHIDLETGDMHLHLAYDLIRQNEDGRAYVQRLGKFENKLQLYAREIELKYGLQILSNERKPGARRAERNELEESRRLGTDIHEIRTTIMQAYHASDSGRAFQAAMKEQGFEIAAGDRRDCFVVVDELGGKHTLNKKLTGMTLKEIAAKLGDLDRAQLPSVDQAKAMQLDRQSDRVIRMYRGIGNNVELGAAQVGGALFFSTDPARAAAFGQIHYVDITLAEMAKFERPHSERILEAEPIAENDWTTADPKIIARLKPLENDRVAAAREASQTRETARDAMWPAKKRPHPRPRRRDRSRK